MTPIIGLSKLRWECVFYDLYDGCICIFSLEPIFFLFFIWYFANFPVSCFCLRNYDLFFTNIYFSSFSLQTVSRPTKTQIAPKYPIFPAIFQPGFSERKNKKSSVNVPFHVSYNLECEKSTETSDLFSTRCTSLPSMFSEVQFALVNPPTLLAPPIRPRTVHPPNMLTE